MQILKFLLCIAYVVTGSIFSSSIFSFELGLQRRAHQSKKRELLDKALSVSVMAQMTLSLQRVQLLLYLMIFQAYRTPDTDYKYVFPLPHASHQIGRVGTNPCCKTLSVALHSRQWSACWINQPVVLMSLVQWNRLVDKITLGRSPPLHCPL